MQNQPLPVSPERGSEKCRQWSRQGAGVPVALCVCLTCGALALCLHVKGQCYLR